MPVSRQPDGNDVTLISVQAFTPILGTLLLSSNGLVSGPARSTVVDLLCRIRKADQAQESGSESSVSSSGLFGPSQRQSFEQELIHQLVIGIGRLDTSTEDEDVAEIWYDATARTPAGELPGSRHCTSTFSESDPTSVNPYFPYPLHEPPTSPPAASTTDSFLTSSFTIPSFQLTPEVSCGDPSPMADLTFRPDTPCLGKSHTHTQDHPPNGMPSDHQSIRKEVEEADEDVDPGEQAAVGRLSSMSLIAAVAAGGMSYTRHFIHPLSNIVAVRFSSVRRPARLCTRS